MIMVILVVIGVVIMWESGIGDCGGCDIMMLVVVALIVMGSNFGIRPEILNRLQ